MRIVSQDRKYDVPYNENMVLGIKKQVIYSSNSEEPVNKNIIGAFSVNISDDFSVVMAEYDTEEECERVMSTLHSCYIDYPNSIFYFPEKSRVDKITNKATYDVCIYGWIYPIKAENENEAKRIACDLYNRTFNGSIQPFEVGVTWKLHGESADAYR